MKYLIFIYICNNQMHPIWCWWCGCVVLFTMEMIG